MQKIAQYFIKNYFKRAGIELDGTQPYDIRVINPHFYTRVFLYHLCGLGSLAFGETYVDGWWKCDRIDEMIYRLQQSRFNEERPPGRLKRLWYWLLWHLYNPQSVLLSRRVAAMHYDLGNNLYRPMLGESMAYSCGYWKPDTKTLDEAQFAKYDLICRKLGLNTWDKKHPPRILEIGCGFGGFAKHAAKRYGANVVGVTLSKEQLEFGKALCDGLPVDLRLIDYRLLSRGEFPDGFDFIVSIGMFEHVGPSNYSRFMAIAADMLRPGGLFLLHTIGTRGGGQEAWIAKYIFPGGRLPRLPQILHAAEGRFPKTLDVHNFGHCYDYTLMAWLKNFHGHSREIELAKDERFVRMWNYYLASCAGAFRAQILDLWQIVFSKDEILGGYQSVR
ncbi:MAG: cyclopropane fatty acyl phospholipid synthase [Patescibacteria group bacterium]|nr:cyclopropane fatty acyl phospholipid synthase [Patescibacteria group bacterium]